MKHFLLGLVGALTLGGCAKFPTNGTTESTHVIFRMTVRGEINPSYVYIFPIRVSTLQAPIDDGPLPVIAYPNANGFVAGHVDYFVVWTPDTQQYTLYQFNDANLTLYTAVGTPINSVDWTSGSKTLGFELALEQIVGTAGTWDQIQSLQVNFLNMNYRLTAGASASSRVMDCLGDTTSFADLNEPVTIPVATSGTYDNTNVNPIREPSFQDCIDNDLDITEWSVQVSRQ